MLSRPRRPSFVVVGFLRPLDSQECIRADLNKFVFHVSGKQTGLEPAGNWLGLHAVLNKRAEYLHHDP